jgi:hypothetical protein
MKLLEAMYFVNTTGVIARRNRFWEALRAIYVFFVLFGMAAPGWVFVQGAGLLPNAYQRKGYIGCVT